MPRKGLTKEQFIEKANKKHNDKYDYSNLIIKEAVRTLHFNRGNSRANLLVN